MGSYCFVRLVVLLSILFVFYWELVGVHSSQCDVCIRRPYVPWGGLKRS